MKSYVTAVAGSLLLIARVVAADRPPVPPDFPTIVDEVQRTWNMPGVAIAVVQDGSVAYVEGFGLREINRVERVDGDTQFGIASVTKLLVTGAIALLVDQGQVDLDQPVRRYLPEFEVADAYVTANVTVGDLLSHRSGFDFDQRYVESVEQLGTTDSSELVKRSRHIGQAFPFRERWQYNNYGFLVAAEIIGRVSGMPWHEFIRRQVVQPLGMQQTWARSYDFLPRDHVLPTGDGWSESIPRGLAKLPAALNIAVPHIQWPKMQPQLYYEKKELERTTVHFHRSPIDPCQSAWSSARDLATYAEMWMNDGSQRGRSFLQRATVDQFLRWSASVEDRWPLKPRVDATRVDDTARDFAGLRRQVAQASGFAIYDYAGHLQYGHDGWELGYATLLRIDPARKLAVVVLVNNALYGEGELATLILASAIFDWHYGRLAVDRRAVFEAYRQDETRRILKYRAKKDALAVERDVLVKPTVPVHALVGTYRHPFAGEMKVALRGKQLVASTDATAEWILKPWRSNVFDGDWQGALIGRKFFAFQTGENATVTSLMLPDDKLIYERVP